MPLERVGVRNEYALGAPELYRDVNKEDPKEILEGVTVAGLVGVLRQLGDLAEFAGEVFHGLQEEVTVTSSRSRKLMVRVQRIEAALSPLEKAVLAQKSHLHFAYTAGTNWHARIRYRQSHFLYSEVPQFIMDSYEECRDLPNLQLLDRFDPAGPGSCFRRYSDPTFFKRASVASGEISAKKISKDKKGRRVKRRTWPRNGDVSQDGSFSYNSGRMQFTQLNIGVHPSPSQTATTLRSELDEQLNLGLRNGSSYAEGDSRPSFSVQPELDEQLNLGLRNGSSYAEGDSRPSFSVQPEERESRESISSPVMRRNSDFLDYDFLREKTTDAYDDIQINLPQERPASSSSLTWDEKGEMFEPITQESDADTGTILENDNDVKAVGYKALDFETVEEMDVQPLAVPTLENTDDHLDDIESETDQFLDALNTIESEGDTDVEWSKKQEMHDSVRNEECQLIRDHFEVTSSIESNVLANDSVTSVADTSCGHLDSVFQESSHEINGSIQAVAANDEVNSVSLDGKTLQLFQTDGKSLTLGGPLQVKNEFNSFLVIENVLQSSQTDERPSSLSCPIQAKDEFNLVSVSDKTVQSSQADALLSTPSNLFLEKDELNAFSKVDEILLTSKTDAMSSTPGSLIQAKDELHSDKIVELSQTDAKPSTPGSLFQAEDELNSVSIVEKISQSYQPNGVSSTPVDLFPGKEHNTISMVDKTLQSSQTDGVSLTPGSPQSIDSRKNGSINSGKNVESVSCNLSSNLLDNGSGVQITDGTMSSLESRKPASDTSSVASVSFWTNGGLLGLQPSKPPDFTMSNGIPQDNAHKKDDKSENLKNAEEINSSNSHEYQETTGASLRKPSWKISPADLSIDLGKLSNSLHSSTSSIGSSATASGSLMPINSTFQALRKSQEYSGSSSQMFGLSNRLQPNGSNKKLLPGGDDFGPKNHRNGTYRILAGQNKDLLCGGSPLASPCSSPPLHHMKISFQPMDGFETSKLKLKFPEGNVNGRSVSDIFPSFQLVPEATITRHNDDSDSDADTFYRSSPSVSDDCHCNQSESNSEQWESNESSTGKDPELYDALRRISLTESVSTTGLGLQNSDPSQMFGHQSLGSASHSFRKEVRNGFEPSADAPPLPPVQWRGTATSHLDDMEHKCETTAEDSYYAFRLQHSSSTISQPKPAPAKEDHIDSVKLQISKFNLRNTNGQQKGAGQDKSLDEKGDFLHQIRTKSFNLRPTFIDKPTAPPPEASAPAHVQVNAILEKANAIRQAVGSDDDGTWSDT